MRAKPAFNRRYTLRRPTGGSGSVKPQSGLRPWCDFTSPQFGQGSMLRIALLPAQTVVYLERYTTWGKNKNDKH